MIGLIQVTIGTSATQVSSDHIPCAYAIIQADDGNSNPAFFGASGVTSATGIRLHNSATVPERDRIGPFNTNLFDLSELYVAGTDGEKVNILYVQH